MSLERDISWWQEVTTDGVSCEYLPMDYSCDNAITFTAEFYALLGKSGIVPELDAVLFRYEKSPGELLRHPNSTEVTSWDDHLAAAAMSPWMAQRIYAFGEKNGWTWGGKFLGRFPIFIPTVKASAGYKLTLLDKVLVCGTYLANCFEGHEHTSGKLSLWLASKALFGHSLLIDSTIRLWRFVQSKRYKRGLKEVMEIYFPPKKAISPRIPMSEWSNDLVPHPFSVYAPENFD